MGKRPCQGSVHTQTSLGQDGSKEMVLVLALALPGWQASAPKGRPTARSSHLPHPERTARALDKTQRPPHYRPSVGGFAVEGQWPREGTGPGDAAPHLRAVASGWPSCCRPNSPPDLRQPRKSAIRTTDHRSVDIVDLAHGAGPGAVGARSNRPPWKPEGNVLHPHRPRLSAQGRQQPRPGRETDPFVGKPAPPGEPGRA